MPPLLVLPKNYKKYKNTKDTDVVMSMYNLLEYSINYSKTSGILWQYCRDEADLNGNGNIAEFNVADATNLLNFKAKITDQTGDNGKKNVGVMGPLKYLRSFWRTLEMPLKNSNINLILTWSANCDIVSIAM